MKPQESSDRRPKRTPRGPQETPKQPPRGLKTASDRSPRGISREICQRTSKMPPMPSRTIATEHAGLARWRDLPQAAGSAAPCGLATGVPGVLDDLGFGFGSFPKELPLGLRRVPPATRKVHQSMPLLPQDGPRWLPRRPRQAIKAAKMAQLASKTAPESTKMPQDCLETAHEAAKTAHVRPTEPREASKTRYKTTQTSPEEAKSYDVRWVFVSFWCFSKL